MNPRVKTWLQDNHFAGKVPGVTTAMKSDQSIQGVIFDMDGVIIDSEPLHERAFEEIWAELGFGENHGIDFTDFYGTSDREVWEEFLRRHRPGKSIDELVAWKMEKYLTILRDQKPIFAGVMPLLERLAPHYSLALASGSVHAAIEAVMELGDIRRFFPVVVSVEDVPRSKPAPDIFLQAAQGLGVEAKRCVVIEDSVAGVMGAKAAGMHTIAITNTFPADALQHADEVVGSYPEIGDLLYCGGSSKTS